MKYQYGYEYHTDNSQKLSKYKDYLTRNLATKHSTAKHGQNNQYESTRRSTPSEEPHSSTQGMQPKIESPLSLANKWQKFMYVSHNDVDQNRSVQSLLIAGSWPKQATIPMDT